MKKASFTLAGIFAILIGTTALAQGERTTFRVRADGANEPSIKLNSVVSVSKLKKPALFDFVCYNGIDLFSGQKGMCVSRLCAQAGDVVEIKNGVAFVNGRDIDAQLVLREHYLLSEKERSTLTQAGVDLAEITYKSEQDFSIIWADKNFLAQHKLTCKKWLWQDADEYIQRQWHKEWNVDNFGPVTVPAHNVFLLGDNRHNTVDSRYRGFIPETDILAVILQ